MGAFEMTRRELIAALAGVGLQPSKRDPATPEPSESIDAMRAVLSDLPPVIALRCHQIINPRIHQRSPFDGTVTFVDWGPRSGNVLLYFPALGTDYRQILPLEWNLPRDGYRVICVHRPGYAGTSLREGFLDAEATAVLALQVLEATLGNQSPWSVGVIGTSGGAPAALSFASSFPERTKLLVLQGGVAHPWTGPDGLPGPGGERFAPELFQDAYRWAFRGGHPATLRDRILFGFAAAAAALQAGPGGRMVRFAGTNWQEFAAADPAGFKFVLNLILGLPLPGEVGSRWPRGISWLSTFVADLANLPGAANDFRSVLLAKATYCDWTRIVCPTLIAHATSDPVVPFEHAEFSQTMLTSVPPDARQLARLDVAGHIIWQGRGAGKLASVRQDFLARHFS